MSEKQFYVYMLRCGDDSLYTGYTDNPQKRLEAHANGRGANIPDRIYRYPSPDTGPAPVNATL